MPVFDFNNAPEDKKEVQMYLYNIFIPMKTMRHPE